MRTNDTSMFGLGRNPSPVDPRDFKLSAFMPADLGDLSGSMAWPFNSAPLDQEDWGHCVGFGGANFQINDPVQGACTNQDGHDLYYMCKAEDGEPFMENGSTVRSIAKVLQKVGRIKNYAFATTVDEITYWLLNHGPVIVGTWWTDGMCAPDADNVIHPDGQVRGGHCYLLNGKTAAGYYRIQNSWGTRWGVNSESRISIADFQSLFVSGGEALSAVELPLKAAAKESCIASFMRIFEHAVPA